jgi:hypothetical protein
MEYKCVKWYQGAATELVHTGGYPREPVQYSFCNEPVPTGRDHSEPVMGNQTQCSHVHVLVQCVHMWVPASLRCVVVDPSGAHLGCRLVGSRQRYDPVACELSRLIRHGACATCFSAQAVTVDGTRGWKNHPVPPSTHHTTEDNLTDLCFEYVVEPGRALVVPGTVC